MEVLTLMNSALHDLTTKHTSGGDPNARLRPDLVPAFNNDKYTVVFTDARD